MRDIDLATAERSLRDGAFDLIRRGEDGALVMSTDRWALEAVAPTELCFRAQPPAPPGIDVLILPRERIERITWDRLPKQRVRSQVRFHLHGGDLWTFSGDFEEPTEG